MAVGVSPANHVLKSFRRVTSSMSTPVSKNTTLQARKSTKRQLTTVMWLAVTRLSKHLMRFVTTVWRRITCFPWSASSAKSGTRSKPLSRTTWRHMRGCLNMSAMSAVKSLSLESGFSPIGDSIWASASYAVNAISKPDPGQL